MAQPDLVVVDVDVPGLATDARSLAATGLARPNPEPVDRPVGVTVRGRVLRGPRRRRTLGARTRCSGSSRSAALAPLETRAVEAAVSGSLPFLGSPIRAFVDAGLAVVEVRRDQQRRPGRRWLSGPPPGPPYRFARSGPGRPANVASTPAVADLDGDGVPDVVFWPW